ncbi:MAG: hypothetical protein GY768_01760 [Planctomycetaceae bacterium]|nr:hypothetical protein [Planctomycetaceae bacterium]
MRSGTPAEYLRLKAGSGTYIFLERPIEHSRVIDDLVAGVWVRSDRQRLRIFGQVVLPKTINPSTDAATRVRIPGELYESPGGWQQLNVANLPALLERQLPVLRARLKTPVDVRGAYLESLIINGFGGPGTTRIWLDEVEMQGSVNVQSNLPRLKAPKPKQNVKQKGPRLQVSKLTIDGRPFFPRIVDHHGESFELLKQLGFNTIALKVLPSRQQQHEAQRLNLKLICPPPETVDSTTDFPPVIAWHLGDDISAAIGIRTRVDSIRRHDPRARLIIAGTAEHQWSTSRQVDILLRSRYPIGTSFQLSEYDEWLHQTTRLARPGTPFWSSIQTELPQVVLDQTRSLAPQAIQLSSRIDMEQMRQLCLSAISAGSRGLWFRTFSRLDLDRADAQQARQMLERLNIELLLLSPWVMGGKRVGTVPCQNPSRQMVTLATERSRLLITTSTVKDSQFVGMTPSGADTILVAGAPDSIDVYLLTPIGLRPVRHRRISGGVQIDLNESSADSMILMTEDPLVVAHVNGLVKEKRNRAAILEYQIARNQLQMLRDGFAEQEQQEHAREFAEATASLQVCQKLLESGDVTDVYRFARQAARASAQIRFHIWQKATANQAHPLSHPAGSAFHLVTHKTPTNFDLAKTESWPGGDCEDLEQMIEFGWRQFQTSPDDIKTYIALSPNQPRTGSHSLRLRVEALSEEAASSIVEAPPVWVNSAPITVYPGQRLLISGWIRIDQSIRGSGDGFVIRDSIGGSALAQRFQRTKGWQRFEIIRAADQRDHLTLTFALSGLGEVWLDDLQITRLLDKRRLVSQN